MLSNYCARFSTINYNISWLKVLNKIRQLIKNAALRTLNLTQVIYG